MESRLSDEQEAELGLLVRVVYELCTKQLELTLPAASMISVLTESLVRAALLRAKPDRRIPHLEQWRQFLAWLVDSIANSPPKLRAQIAEKAIREFKLFDRRGKSKPKSPIPTGTNCLLLKDNELWFAKVQSEDFLATPGLTFGDEPDNAGVARAGGEEDITQENMSSSVRTDRAEYLQPFYPPGVLKREHTKLCLSLPQTDPIDENEITAMVVDVPRRRLRTWIVDGGVTRSDLALLIAAHRAGLTAKVSNLPHLHTSLRCARV